MLSCLERIGAGGGLVKRRLYRNTFLSQRDVPRCSVFRWVSKIYFSWMALRLARGRSSRRSYLLDPKAPVFAHYVQRVRLFWARLLPPSLHILSRDLLATPTTYITLLLHRALPPLTLCRHASFPR